MTALLDQMVNRRRAALFDKLDALGGDFAEWIALSEKGKSLEKHHTQIGRLVRRLERLRAALYSDIEALGSAGASALADGHVLERDVLFLHNMWEFFRGKFAQRCVPWMKGFLDAADDYAWACLEPVSKAAVAAGHIAATKVREPPLTHLNSDWSPFAATRGTSFMSVTVPTSGTDRDAFIREVKTLPLSVLGVPWYQLSHLPDALILAHEVGHVVEDDLKLTPVLLQHLNRTFEDKHVPESRAAAWRAWLGEAFADVFGTAAGGRAFCFALLDFVTLDVSDVRTELAQSPAWGFYPITALRADLMAGALEVLGDAAGASEVVARRDALLDGSNTMPAFRNDAKAIARTWLESKLTAFGDTSLASVARIPRTHWQEAERVSSAAIGTKLPLPSSDVRVLVSGARIAFEAAPEKYRLPLVPLSAVKGDVQSLVLSHLAATRKQGVRGPREFLGEQHAPALQQYDDDEADRLRARLRTRT